MIELLLLLSSRLSGYFLGIVLFFSKFGHGGRNLHEVVLWPKTKNVPKQGFLNLLKNLVINFN